MAIEAGDDVTIEYTGRLPDGTVFDTTRREVAEEAGLAAEQPGRDYGPMTIPVGEGRVIEGLEAGLQGLEAGDEETMTLTPEEAYGERSDDRIVEYERDEFEAALQGAEVETGMQIQSEEGAIGSVVAADDERVRVDFNHALAGETLEFDVEVVDVS